MNSILNYLWRALLVVLPTLQANPISKSLRVCLWLGLGLSLPLTTWGQDWQWRWGRQSNNTNDWSETWAVASDPSGNAYVCGSFAGTNFLRGWPIVTFAASDMFLAKYAPDGTPLWSWNSGATPTPITDVVATAAYGVAVDRYGNVYVAGSFAGTNFTGSDSNFVGPYTLVSAGEVDVFVACYSPDGSLIWTRQAGGTGWDCAQALAIDKYDNLYLVGQFASPSIQFGTNPPLSCLSPGKPDVFIAKYDTAGRCHWARSAGGQGSDIAYGVAVEGTQYIYITGMFENSATFGGFALNSAGGLDAFLAKYDPAGSCLWAEAGGSVGNDSAFAVALPGTNRVCIAGYFQGAATFGSHLLSAPGANHTDWFVAQYDSQGRAVWAKAAAGSNVYGRALAADAAGDLYVAGILGGTAQFEGHPLTSSGPLDLVLAAYDAQGTVLWNCTSGNPNAYANGLAHTPSGDLLAVGGFQGDARFGRDTLANRSGLDSFLAKFGPTGSSSGLRLLAGTGSDGPHPFSLVELQTDPVLEVGVITNSRYFTTLDTDPAGTLYGASSSLYRIDPVSHQVTTLGKLHTATASSLSMRSMAFAPDGVLYAVADNVLYTVEPSTCLATEVGTITNGSVWGIEFAPDGRMFGAFLSLYLMDRQTGRILSKIGSLPSPGVLDIDFAEDGFLYGVNYLDSNLRRINPDTAASTLVGTYQSPLWSVVSFGGTTLPSNQPPTIVGQPQSVTTDAGSTVGLSVTAIGSPLLAYNWVKDGTPLAGASSSKLKLANVQTAHAGGYLVIVTNAYGAVTSSVAQLTIRAVAPPPALHLTQSPPDITTNSGATVALEVVATGALPLAFQWRHDGTPIPDATDAQLILVDVRTNQSGWYTVRVSDCRGGCLLSVPALLTVTLDPTIQGLAPRITCQPQSVTAFVGENVSLSATATGTAPLNYQWFKDTAPIPEARQSTLLLSAVDLNAGGRYQVEVRNALSSVMSGEAVVRVLAVGIANVRASQRPGTNLVDITYDLGAATNQTVGLSASADGGTNWSRAAACWGDVGANVLPGANRRVVWSAGDDWPNQQTFNMVARVATDTTRQDSAPFAVDTRAITSWKVRPWLDLNRNGRREANEVLTAAEIYVGGRTRAHKVSFVVEGDSLRIDRPLQPGDPLFLRVITTKPAIKPNHQSVDNLMFAVWFDSDLGPRDGTAGDADWRSYVVTASDLAGAAVGLPIDVQLRHVIFDWNLVVASEISSSDFLTPFKAGLEKASHLLFDVTDGQMKLGKVAIYTGVTQNSTAWRNADVVVYSRIEDQSLYQKGTIFWAMPGGVNFTRPEDHIYLGAHARGAPPDSVKYYHGFVHEFGHYALMFLDEYLDGNKNQVAWYYYRVQHPDLAPEDFGLMDAAGAYTPEMSSYNEYLASYTGPISETNLAARAAISEQIYFWWLQVSNRWSPCWEILEYNFEFVGRGFGLDLVVPPRGHYAGYQQRSQSPRQGPATIPAPYVPVEFVVLPATSSMLSAKPPLVADSGSPGRTAHIRATRQGQPLNGVQLIRYPAREDRLVALGSTDPDGELTVYDLEAADVLAARWHGRERRLTVPPRLDRSGTISLEMDPELTTGGGARKLGKGQTPDLGVIVLPTLLAAPERTLRLTLRSSDTLAALPSVVVHPDDAGGVAIPMSPAGANRFAGNAPLAEATGGTVDLSCESATGGTLSSFDVFTVTSVITTNAVMLRSRDGWAEFNLDPGAVLTDEPGLVYSSYAPVLPLPAPTFSQVGPTLTATLASGNALNGTYATLNVFYRDAAVAGLDEASLRLYRWNDAQGNWQLVPSQLAISMDTLSANLNELGTFALFAEPSADTDPPGAISDLQAVAGSGGWSVRLDWTAPGGDGRVGKAASYVLRTSRSEITSVNLPNATIVPLPILPHPVGTPETYEIFMPSPGAQYYFVLQALDEAGNVGPLSNLAGAPSHQEDSDGDGMPDQWEASYELNPFDPADAPLDLDGDGLSNREEYLHGINPRSGDTDGDGLSDPWEINHGLNPASADDRDLDSDGDGLPNFQEYHAGTAPDNSDTDHDGLPDKWEIDHGLCAFSTAGDNGAEGDPDHDGLSNQSEFLLGLNPMVPDNLRIAECGFLADGTFHLAIQGKLGASYALQVSTNPLQWSTLTTFECTNNPTGVVDPELPNSSRKFYRVVLSGAAN